LCPIVPLGLAVSRRRAATGLGRTAPAARLRIPPGNLSRRSLSGTGFGLARAAGLDGGAGLVRVIGLAGALRPAPPPAPAAPQPAATGGCRG
jgi:hypothetical protein